MSNPSPHCIVSVGRMCSISLAILLTYLAIITIRKICQYLCSLYTHFPPEMTIILAVTASDKCVHLTGPSHYKYMSFVPHCKNKNHCIDEITIKGIFKPSVHIKWGDISITDLTITLPVQLHQQFCVTPYTAYPTHNDHRCAIVILFPPPWSPPSAEVGTGQVGRTLPFCWGWLLKALYE